MAEYLVHVGSRYGQRGDIINLDAHASVIVRILIEKINELGSAVDPDYYDRIYMTSVENANPGDLSNATRINERD